MMWDERDAAREAARREFVKGKKCPNCGADADVEIIDVSTHGRADFLPGMFTCSARCFDEDPEGYLAAVRKATT